MRCNRYLKAINKRLILNLDKQKNVEGFFFFFNIIVIKRLNKNIHSTFSSDFIKKKKLIIVFCSENINKNFIIFIKK